MPTSPEIRSVIRVLETFKELTPDDRVMTVNAMLSFLYFSEQDDQGGNQRSVEARLDVDKSAASRNAMLWQKWRRPRVPGLDMMESVDDPADRRYKKITLNRRGLDFLEKLKKAAKGPSKVH